VRLTVRLRVGAYEAIYVRRLEHPLGNNAAQAVQKFAVHVCTAQPGKTAAAVRRVGAQVDSLRSGSRHSLSGHSSDEEVAVLMAADAPRLACKPAVERFSTSRLVAEMLVATEQVAGQGHLYTACTHDDRLLRPLAELDAPERLGWSRRARVAALQPGGLTEQSGSRREEEGFNPFSADVITVR
jgi:hypothetical protein